MPAQPSSGAQCSACPCPVLGPCRWTDRRTDGQQQAPSTSWGQTQHRARPALLFDLARGVTHCLNPLLVLSATLVFHESRLGSPRRGRGRLALGGLQPQGRVAWCCRAPARSTAPWVLPLRCSSAWRGAGCLPHPLPCPGGRSPAPQRLLYRLLSDQIAREGRDFKYIQDIFYTCLVTEYPKCMISTMISTCIDYLETDSEEAGWLGNCLTVW